eukprot:EG_transcript_7348
MGMSAAVWFSLLCGLSLVTPTRAVCLVRKDNGTVITNVFCLILLFIVLSLGDMVRATRPRNDVIVFALSAGLLAASAVCGAFSSSVMDELSWLLVGTIAVLLAVQLVCSGWWWSRDHHFLMVLYSFSSPRLNLVVVFAAVYHQLAKVSAPLLYFICMLYLAVSLVLAGQPSKYSKYMNPRAYRMTGRSIPKNLTGSVELLFGRASDERAVTNPIVAPAPATLAPLPREPPRAPTRAASQPVELAEEDAAVTFEAVTCCRAAGEEGPHPREEEEDPVVLEVEEALHQAARVSVDEPRKHRSRLLTSGFWLACVRLIAAAVAFAMFVALCVAWAVDPLVTCYDTSGSGGYWEYATTAGSWPVSDNAPTLYLVERPFAAAGNIGTLYQVDVVSQWQLSHPSRLCPAPEEYSHKVDVAAADGSLPISGYLRFTVCRLDADKQTTWSFFKDVRFDVDVLARMYQRVTLTQRQASPAWYGNQTYPFVGFVIGLVLNSKDTTYTAAWKVYALPRVDFMQYPVGTIF